MVDSRLQIEHSEQIKDRGARKSLPMAQPLSARDGHLFGPGPKRILAIDGGGVRAVLALALLEQIEVILSARAGRKVRLCDYFDLIGGTSSGAITACGLALGYSAEQVREIYAQFSPRVFRRGRWHIPGLQAKFDSRVMQRELKGVIGDRRLDSLDLLTGLAIIMKRMDTGSAWVVSNNPRSQYWETPSDRAFIGNREFPLVNLLRASTAAPTYFDAEPVTIVEGAPPGLFIDGGLTPHRNPTLQLLMMALINSYGLNWQGGADQLLVVSVGAGSYRHRMAIGEAASLGAVGLAVRALSGVMDDFDMLQEVLLHWLSGSPSLWRLNTEIGKLSGQQGPLNQPIMTFHRYDVRLETEWLNTELGLGFDEAELVQLRRMDVPELIPRLYDLGKLAAQRFIQPDDLPSAFDGGITS
jgi:hypothetical protein